MIAVQSRESIENRAESIIRDRTLRPGMTSGTPASALASYQSSDDALWKQAINEMLGWKSASSVFEPPDQPSSSCIESAIDYAMDQIREHGPAPASIIPSGSGRIAMEWNEGSVTVIVEFVDLGHATLTRFVGQRVASKQILVRNPKSRKLELRG